ncbi:MAG: hypothetical protein Q8P67_26125 [archaeon]|nr:hypothetical protein [archaeon]
MIRKTAMSEKKGCGAEKKKQKTPKEKEFQRGEGSGVSALATVVMYPCFASTIFLSKYYRQKRKDKKSSKEKKHPTKVQNE